MRTAPPLRPRKRACSSCTAMQRSARPRRSAWGRTKTGIDSRALPGSAGGVEGAGPRCGVMKLDVEAEVAEALRGRRPVVALETSVIAQGLPPPLNLEAARRCAAAVRAEGAVPAAIAVIHGRILVGAREMQLARLADPSRKPAKAGARDLAAVCARRLDAGTTVSATCAVAERAGIRIFATGGLGGVHRRVDPAEPEAVSSDL